MTWLIRIASDEARVARNIERLEDLRESIHELAYYGTASQSGGFTVLQDMLDNRVVLGRPNVLKKLKEALIGENNQKVALDAPTRFQRILFEAEELVSREIGKEKKALKELGADSVADNEKI
jgi:hypothetical protein